MVWIDDSLFFVLSVFFQVLGVLSLGANRWGHNRFRSSWTFVFMLSMVAIGLAMVVAIWSGSYDWPLMGITLGVMIVGTMIDTEPQRTTGII